MKKRILTTVVLLLISGTILAQNTTEKKDDKFEFIINSKLGFARLKQTGIVPLNGNLTGSDAIISYKISPKWDLASGLGYYQFNGNTTINNNLTSLKNTYLHIPVQFNGDIFMFKNENPENEKISLTLGLGLYANTLLKQELETINGNSEAKNLGWNFGISTQVGAKFILSEDLHIGIGIESQSDLTKAKKNGSEQRIEQFNGMYFKFGLKF